MIDSKLTKEICQENWFRHRDQRFRNRAVVSFVYCSDRTDAIHLSPIDDTELNSTALFKLSIYMWTPCECDMVGT